MSLPWHKQLISLVALAAPSGLALAHHDAAVDSSITAALILASLVFAIAVRVVRRVHPLLVRRRHGR